MLKKIFSVSFIGLSLLLSNSAFSDPIGSNSVELGVFGGKGLYDDYGALRIKGPWIFGARVGYFPIKYLSLEPSYQYGITGTQPFSGLLADANIQSFRFNTLYNILPDMRFSPFITVGVGWERFHVDGSGNSNDLGLNAGAGVRFFFTKMVALRADGRYVTVDTAGSRQHNYEVTGGLSFFFGGSEAKPQVVDADGDGIPDDTDACPGTSAKAKVNAKGCPVDADSDGVPDHLDNCLETPQGTKIDAWGCEAKPAVVFVNTDTDGDGVLDSKDQCADTPKGTEVDGKGCPVKTKARGILEGVKFTSGKSELTLNSKKILDGTAKELMEFSKVRVEVQGHTDSTGPDQLNLAISNQRAKAVVEYLVSKGVNRDRIVAKGYGEAKPVDTNTTPEGRAKNRRVALIWLDE